nr:MAG TPA: hypothetical protein [Caudoviricetes sp.]
MEEKQYGINHKAACDHCRNFPGPMDRKKGR